MLIDSFAARQQLDQRAIKAAGKDDPAIRQRRDALHARREFLRQARIAHRERSFTALTGDKDLPGPTFTVGKEDSSAEAKRIEQVDRQQAAREQSNKRQQRGERIFFPLMSHGNVVTASTQIANRNRAHTARPDRNPRS